MMVKVTGVMPRRDGSLAMYGEVLEVTALEFEDYKDVLEVILADQKGPQVDKMMRPEETK